MVSSMPDTNQTRWEELCVLVKTIVKLVNLFDPTGVDLYFLNRSHTRNVTDLEIVENNFSIPPRGYTPLARVLRSIFQQAAERSYSDKELLVIVATDGAPTDDNGNLAVDELRRVMNGERRVETTHVQFLVCTDAQEFVEYLRDWDREMVNVGVTDNIRSRKNQKYLTSNDDYVINALLGPILLQHHMSCDEIVEDSSDME